MYLRLHNATELLILASLLNADDRSWTYYIRLGHQSRGCISPLALPLDPPLKANPVPWKWHLHFQMPWKPNETTWRWSEHTCQWLSDLQLAKNGSKTRRLALCKHPLTCNLQTGNLHIPDLQVKWFMRYEFWSSDFLSSLSFGPVTDGQTHRQTESDAYEPHEPTVYEHRCAQKSQIRNCLTLPS